ncbi:ABC transporter ATP-binding protein [Motiliproteus sp. MSK22-1]|uniref:ABC transporter ATP-binding protein n=2 Tax=Motiliproteus sp. MSK22-1 TaxID=1897630 RepID=UPI0009F83CA7|nr:ABC transporter ATP-binding protein [Motiliproteus sp. MSK22-1]
MTTEHQANPDVIAENRAQPPISPATEPSLKVTGLSSHYGPIQAIADISLDVYPGELVTIVGANGAGKTTLLHTLSGVQKATAGSVIFEGQDITNRAAHRITAEGICHSPEGRQVFAPLSVEDNLRLGAFARRADKAQLEAEIEGIYALFPVLKEKRQLAAGTLSGGQQQMLAIGRAMMGQPKLLLLDEPSMGLSPLLVGEIFRVIQDLNSQGVTILLVEQNARAALQIADRGYVLESGRVAISAPARELLEDESVRKAYLGH